MHILDAGLPTLRGVAVMRPFGKPLALVVVLVIDSFNAMGAGRHGRRLIGAGAGNGWPSRPRRRAGMQSKVLVAELAN